MTKTIPHLFADVTARLEDLHSLAVEGQRADNAPDMQSVLIVHLRFGLVALDDTLRLMASAVKTGLKT